MNELQHDLDNPAASSVPAQEFERAYLRVRKTLAEAHSRATQVAEQQRWQAGSTRMRRVRDMLDVQDLSEVRAAITVVHAEQQAADAGIASQLAAADTRSHR